MTGAAGDGDGLLLTGAATDGRAGTVIGRISHDPPTATIDGGLVLTLTQFGEDGTFHPESAADVDEALALVDAVLSPAMSRTIAALAQGFAVGREDARAAGEGAADARARAAAALLAEQARGPVLEPANACWGCGELIQRHDGASCPNCEWPVTG